MNYLCETPPENGVSIACRSGDTVSSGGAALVFPVFPVVFGGGLAHQDSFDGGGADG